METRTFGRVGWPVSAVGYGLWGMGGWTGSDDAESAATPDAADPEASASDAETSDAGDAAGTGSEDRGEDPEGVEDAAAVSVAEDGGGAAPWAGVALTVALVAGLGVVAVRRSRQRGGSAGGP